MEIRVAADGVRIERTAVFKICNAFVVREGSETDRGRAAPVLSARVDRAEHSRCLTCCRTTTDVSFITDDLDRISRYTSNRIRGVEIRVRHFRRRARDGCTDRKREDAARAAYGISRTGVAFIACNWNRNARRSDNRSRTGVVRVRDFRRRAIARRTRRDSKPIVRTARGCTRLIGSVDCVSVMTGHRKRISRVTSNRSRARKVRVIHLRRRARFRSALRKREGAGRFAHSRAILSAVSRAAYDIDRIARHAIKRRSGGVVSGVLDLRRCARTRDARGVGRPFRNAARRHVATDPARGTGRELVSASAVEVAKRIGRHTATVAFGTRRRLNRLDSDGRTDMLNASRRRWPRTVDGAIHLGRILAVLEIIPVSTKVRARRSINCASSAA